MLLHLTNSAHLTTSSQSTNTTIQSEALLISTPHMKQVSPKDAQGQYYPLNPRSYRGRGYSNGRGHD
jgi:hypothetical protein